jgi:hypothetical protein
MEDLPAWAALSALLGGCPVMLANVHRPHGKPLLSVNPTEFQFVAQSAHIAAIRRFLETTLTP